MRLFLPTSPPGAAPTRPARFLRRLGPTWRAAPWRRLVQVGCLALFLGLFFVVAWPYAGMGSGDIRDPRTRTGVPLELFLWLDPLSGAATALAARSGNVALWGLLAVALLGLVFPRGFCGYLCPLGTLIDGFDWLVGKRVRKLPGLRDLRLRRGAWVHLRFFVLAAVLVAAASGVLLAGYVAAIPVLTRGLLFTGGRLQLGLLRSGAQPGPLDGAWWLAAGLFAGVFALGLLRPRFWCRYLCPSGALLSLLSALRLTQRRVSAACTGCGACRRHCPFDAIADDFTTRPEACASCQTCAGVCPVNGIDFAWRDGLRPAAANGCGAAPAAPALTPPVSRRGLLLGAIGGALATVATRPALVGLPRPRPSLLRPPGSVAEDRFLALCIRCGECFKVCPGPVLLPAGFAHGLDALWTPVVVPAHAGCHPDCHYCTQVCPTGAIQPLTPEAKRRWHIGLAVVDPALCLPHRAAAKEECRLCYDECVAAGYRAIELRPVKVEVGAVPEGAVSPEELEAMGKIDAPFVNAAACVGCGLCEYRCHTRLVRHEGKLPQAAVVVAAEGGA